MNADCGEAVSLAGGGLVRGAFFFFFFVYDISVLLFNRIRRGVYYIPQRVARRM